MVATKAFVLLGATGDNAYRKAGVWNGLFEAWTNGAFEDYPTDLHVQINQGHTVEEVHEKVMDTLQPFYADVKTDPSWSCKAKNGDCEPETFYALAQPNIWEGEGRYNATGQANNMSFLSNYDAVTSYLSIPPYAYEEWISSIVLYWGGGDKNHIAVEKPFGSGRDSLQDAVDLHHNIIGSGLSESNFHLTDHWLSFFMNENLPTFRGVLEKALGMTWSSADIGRIVITEHEERGFGTRGAFIDGLGQVRDMVQSHLLQVLALTVLDPKAESVDGAKLEFLNGLTLDRCELQQYDGLLQSAKLKYHDDFADSTFCRVFVKSNTEQWRSTELVIQTGKAMDIDLYTVEIFQNGGPGVIKINIGKEEVGIADISVQNWKLVDGSAFEAPLPQMQTKTVTPQVDKEGNGYIVKYDDPSLYFPKPYSKIVHALFSKEYRKAFLTFDQVQRSWEIITGDSPSVCLDPVPEVVEVYRPASKCGVVAPETCDQHKTVRDLYDVDYACNAKHDKKYADVDFYEAKCHSVVV